MQLIFSLVCLVILGIGALIGLWRRAYRMLARLVTLILSVAISFFVAKIALRGGVQSLLEKVVPQLLSDPAFTEALAENPELTNAVGVISQMLFAPLVFLVVYFAVKAVTLIIHKIICAIFRIRGPKLFGLGRLCGLAVGVLCGLVTVLAIVTPVCGYLNVVATAYESIAVEDEMNEETNETAVFAEILDMANAPIAKQVYDLVGHKLFTGLTTAEWDGEKIMLEQEITSIITVVENAGTLGEDEIANYDEDQSTAVQGMVDGVEQSGLLSHLGAGVLSSLSNAWLEGDAFMGISSPDVDADLKGILDAFLLVFSTSDAANIGGDLQTFADIFDLMVDHGLFALLSNEDQGDEADGNVFTEKLTSGEVVGDFYAVLDKNPRMYPVKIAIADTGMRILLNELGGTADELRESHPELLEEMATALKEVPVNDAGEIDSEQLNTDITAALNNNGVEVDSSAVDLVVDSFVDEFTAEELQTLTSDEVIDRLINRFGSAELPEGIEIPDNVELP